MQDGQTCVNDRGGKQAYLSADFTLIPPVVLRLLAQCLGFGARKYGTDNWHKISIDENLNHAMNHINEWRIGDRSEPHLVNALTRLTFALFLAVRDGLQPDQYIRHEEQRPLRKATRSYQNGDLVKVIEPGPHFYKIGEVARVICSSDWSDGEMGLCCENSLGLSQKVKTCWVEPFFQEGDRVVVTDDSNHRFSVGETVTIHRTNGTLVEAKRSDGTIQLLHPTQIEPCRNS